MLAADRGGRRRRLTAGAAAALIALATLGAAPVASAGGQGKQAEPAPRVVIDTDFSRYWDDVTVIGMANVLHDRGRLRLLGIVSDVPSATAVAAIDAIDTAYGHPDVPLGALDGSEADTHRQRYNDVLIDRLRHSVDDSGDVPEAVALYRRLLAKQPDRSVTIVSVGGFSNLARLLDSPRGPALVKRKVERLVQMDGLFPGGGPAFTNQKLDLPAATTVVNEWPTPIAWVDGLGGISTAVGGTLCSTVAAKHPMRIVYDELFECGQPPGDGNWDAPTLLYAVGDIDGTFEELGQGGQAVINAQGGLSWQADSTRPDDVYVHVLDQARLNARIDDLLEAE